MNTTLQNGQVYPGQAVEGSQQEPLQTGAAPRPVAGVRMAYLLSRYPGVSHTFFLNEIRELKKLGVMIEPVSINAPDRPAKAMSPEEAEEAARTCYVKARGAAGALWVTLNTLLRRPRVFMRGMAAALRLGQANPWATLYALFYFVEAMIVGDWMRRRGHRHLHIHFCGPVATVGLLTAAAWGVSCSLSVHGPDEFYDVEKFCLRQKVEGARFIVCISDFCRSQLMRVVSPEHWEKMHVVRLGVDPERFAPVPRVRDAEMPAEILCVGRLVPSKGQLILLKACAALIGEGIRLRLRLVGDGPDRRHLEAFVAQSGLAPFVVFEGARSHEETRLLLQRADIFTLASFAEGVPVALMEAMATEVPCVSTNIAGIPELIRDGMEGLLVPASSSEALAAALRRLIEDADLRRSLGTAGRARVLELYNLPRNVASLAQVFAGQLAEAGQGSGA